MASYDQQPGSLNLSFRRGDSVSAEIDFSISFTGQTVTSGIYSTVSGSLVQPFTSTLTNASTGIANVALTSSQSASLASGTYRWQFTATDGTLVRTWLVGFVEVSG